MVGPMGPYHEKQVGRFNSIKCIFSSLQWAAVGPQLAKFVI